jgi:hypothetical protein
VPVSGTTGPAEVPSEIVAVVPTGPVSIRGNTGLPDIAAEPVSLP